MLNIIKYQIKIIWIKFKLLVCHGLNFEINNEYFTDFSLLVNHAFQDGVHIGMFINELQNNISNVNLKFQVKEPQNVKTKSKNNF